MATTHIFFFFWEGFSEVEQPLPPWPSTTVSSAVVATRNRRQLILPDIGTLKLRTDRLTGSAESRIRAPIGLSDSYDLVLPSGLPTASQSLHVNTTGEMSYQGYRQTINDFFDEELGASQSATAIERFSFGSGVTTFIPARAGSVTGVAILSHTACTDGTATLEVYIGGAATELQAVLDTTNTTFKSTTQATGLDTFAAGDTIDLRLSSDADWLPITANIRGTLEIET